MQQPIEVQYNNQKKASEGSKIRPSQKLHLRSTYDASSVSSLTSLVDAASSILMLN